MGSDLQQRIKQTGWWLYQLISDQSPSLFNKEYWAGKCCAWRHRAAWATSRVR